MTSDHDQPPASGGPTTPRLRPRTLDLPAEEAAPSPSAPPARPARESHCGATRRTATPPSRLPAADTPTVRYGARARMRRPIRPRTQPPADAPRRAGLAAGRRVHGRRRRPRRRHRAGGAGVHADSSSTANDGLSARRCAARRARAASCATLRRGRAPRPPSMPSALDDVAGPGRHARSRASRRRVRRRAIPRFANRIAAIERRGEGDGRNHRHARPPQ